MIGSNTKPLTVASRRVAVYRSPVLPVSEVFIRDQVHALKRWQAVLIGETLRDPRPSLDDLSWKVLYRDTSSGRIRRYADRLLEWASGVSRGKRALLKSVPCDLVHVHFATDAVGLWPTVRRLGKPMAVTLHGYDIRTKPEWWNAGHGGVMMRDYPARLLAMAKSPQVHFIAVSESIREEAIGYGLPADRITVRHIGIDTELFEPPAVPLSQRPPRILFVGRLVEKKGPVYLIEAAAELRARIPGIALDFIGEGPLRDDLVARARELDVTATFHGSQPHAAVRARIGTARALCLPSITASNGDAEGLPMVIQEAQACGVPVVTSAKGGSSEGILDGITGYAFDEKNVEQLVAKLEILLRDGEQVDRMSREALKFVRGKFDIHQCTALLEQHYDHMCNQPPH